MGIPCRTHLDPNTLGWVCKSCKAALAKELDRIAGDFTGRTGDAIFIDKVINIERGDPEVKDMLSGKYTVQYICCKFCHSYVGWAYVKAWKPSESYKVGRFCLELEQMNHCPPKASYL